jgi:hypothetical protein
MLVLVVTALMVAIVVVWASAALANPNLQKDLCKGEGLVKFFSGFRDQVECARFTD